jgi:NAD(P)-dependent dehydrogenase (short-subunit alcohol dehydrogenase family)
MTGKVGGMELKGSTVLILGGAGLVGEAVARALLAQGPRRVVIAGLTREEAEESVAELRGEFRHTGAAIDPFWGDLFVPAAMKDRPRWEILEDAEARKQLVNDLYGELTDEVFRRSALGKLLLEVEPDIVIDSINTAGALAYQNFFSSALALREKSRHGGAELGEVEKHLATIYLPQLIRHTQIGLKGMTEVGTRIYLKIGTVGTGGMGMNIPFTHSEERPSRMLMAKSSLAGAHTLLLYLMARTPGGPAVKEIKPTAAISWKALGQGPIRFRHHVLHRCDAVAPLPLDEAFLPAAERGFKCLNDPIEGVYLHSGENGLFSLGEFETLTSLGLMEFVTPEEIASNVLQEILAHPTGRDVIASLDAATMGPTYRAGVLRSAAIERMEKMEKESGIESVAYEMLGPPRLTKLLFEGAILRRLYGTYDAALAMDPEETATLAQDLVEGNADLRQRIVSTGVPILTSDGRSLLRGPVVKVLPPEPERHPLEEKVVDSGWVDLRPGNWERWQVRIRAVVNELRHQPGVEKGSRTDFDYGDSAQEMRPGRMAAWVFRVEDHGDRIKW